MAHPFVELCSRGVIDAEPCARELGREAPRLHRGMVLAACVLASSMAFIDGTALPVALPRLRADNEVARSPISMIVGSTMSSNERPNTLMQDRSASSTKTSCDPRPDHTF